MMEAIRILFAAVLLPAWLTLHAPAAVPMTTLSGKVVSAKNRAPIANVLVYIIEGEEEALTDAKGEFKVTTTKPFPIKVTAQQLVGKKQKVVVMASTNNLLIELP